MDKIKQQNEELSEHSQNAASTESNIGSHPQLKIENDSVRRQDRLLSHDRIIDILKNGEYGFLAMVSEQNGGYVTPLNYVWHDNAIYFHSAVEGEKQRALTQNGRVSFCVVGDTKVVPNKFTSAYESVLVKGNAVLDLTDSEKIEALELIINKYSANYKTKGMQYARKALKKTLIIRVDIDTVSGKCQANKW